jgi:hypothetical protein
MIITNTTETLKLFRKTPLQYQQTFHTPLKDLEQYVSTIISSHKSIEKGCVTIDQYVFEPNTINAYLSQNGIEDAVMHGVSLEVVGHKELEVLLCSVFSDWVDFLFVPTPKPFVIYADHDEYTTFYSDTKEDLRQVVDCLSSKGYQRIDGYERNL